VNSAPTLTLCYGLVNEPGHPFVEADWQPIRKSDTQWGLADFRLSRFFGNLLGWLSLTGPFGKSWHVRPFVRQNLLSRTAPTTPRRVRGFLAASSCPLTWRIPV